jgi:hypothetical protein
VVPRARQGAVLVAADPVTRRFRQDGLAPGEYRVRATSGTDGRAVSTLDVRAGEVTRAALQLDGERSSGTSTVRLAIAAEGIQSVRAKVHDRVTGALLRDDDFEVVNGVIEIGALSPGWLHIDLVTEEATGCYDVDTDDDEGVRRDPPGPEEQSLRTALATTLDSALGINRQDLRR